MSASRRTAAGVAIAAALALVVPSGAFGSEADAFENKVPPISGQLYGKAGRFELTPTLNLSVNDPFYAKTFGGLKLDYHLTEYWSFGVTGAAGAASPTDSASICTANQGCSKPTDAQLYQVPGRIRSMAGAEVAWSPVYGKLNVLAEIPVHFDLSVMAGADWISYDEVLSADQANPPPAGAGQTPSRASSIGGHVGLGMRLFLSRLLALRFEVKDYLYSAHIGNLDKSQLQNQLFLELGLSFFFPSGQRGSP
jgi:outer membrane beta-barrel protein